MILIATYLSGMEGHFTLTVLSNFTAIVKQIWPVSNLVADEDEQRLMKKQQLIERNTKLMEGARGHLSNLSSKLLGGAAAEADPDDPFDISKIKDEDIDVEAPKKGELYDGGVHN